MLGHLLSWVFMPFFINPFVPAVPATTASTSFAPAVSTSITATSSRVAVTSDVNGKRSTVTLNAPYGTQSEIVDSNGAVYATTTPVSEAQAQKMTEQQQQFAEQMQRQMNQMFQEQQQMLDGMWGNST